MSVHRVREVGVEIPGKPKVLGTHVFVKVYFDQETVKGPFR